MQTVTAKEAKNRLGQVIDLALAEKAVSQGQARSTDASMFKGMKNSEPAGLTEVTITG